MVNFIDLYENNREQFNLYAKMFQKENPHLDDLTCELILRTPLEKAREILLKYETGEIKDPKRTSEIVELENCWTIHHPDDEDQTPKPLTLELIEE